MTIMVVFGLFSLAATGFAVSRIIHIDTAYSGMIHGESTAAVNLSRASRALQATRATIGDLLMARSDADNDSAIKEFEANKKAFVEFIEKSRAALPVTR